MGGWDNKPNKEEAVTKFVIITDQDEEGVFIVERPSILGYVSQGKRTRSLRK